MKKIYIILTHTGTVLSRTIKLYTREDFSHVSIALDPDLKEMYSFGRLNPYNPFYGGFVHEKINEGTFKRFKNTVTCVYSLEIEDYKFNILRKTIKDMENKSEIYKFNILGLIAVSIHLKLRFKNSFYCAEFVKYVLEKSKVTSELPEIIKPCDFRNIKSLRKEYTGKLRDYTLAEDSMLMCGS